MRWNFNSEPEESRIVQITETESRLDQMSINDVWIDLPVDTSIEPESSKSPAEAVASQNQQNLQSVWVLGVFLLLLGYLGQSAALRDAREAPRLQALQINPNSASMTELKLLKGVGEVTAAKIVAEREAGGPYQSAEDLQRVSGIGPKTVDILRDSLTFEVDRE